MKKSLVCFFALLLVLCSCEVQKRKYNKGFYVSRPGKQTSVSKNTSLGFKAEKETSSLSGFSKLILPPDSCDLVEFSDGTSVKVVVLGLDNRQLKYRFCDDEKERFTARNKVIKIHYHSGTVLDLRDNTTSTQVIKIDEPATKTPTSVNTASVENNPPPPPPPPPLPLPSVTGDTPKSDTLAKPGSGCDRIVFRDGTEKSVKVTEVSPYEIRYKLCNNITGPDYVSNVSEIFMIEYKNGKKDVFPETPIQEHIASDEPVSSVPYKPKRNGMAIWSLIFGLVQFSPIYFLGPAIPALILGILYLKNNERDPETYDHPKLAIAGIVLALIAIFIAMMVLVITFL